MLGDSFLIDFTEDDLVANRDGYMTKRQRITLPKRMQRHHATPILLIWFMLGIPFYVLLKLYPIDTACTYLIAVLVSIGFGIVYFKGYSWQRRIIKEDLEKGDVHSVDGIVRLYPRYNWWTGWGNTLRGYDLYIDQQKFELIPSEGSMLTDNKSYFIYYLPNSRLILSFEEAL